MALAHPLGMGDAQSAARDPAAGTRGCSLPATAASPMGPPWGLQVPGFITQVQICSAPVFESRHRGFTIFLCSTNSAYLEKKTFL